MVRARLTWRTPEWSAATWVEELPRIRAKYGNEIAEVIEFARQQADIARTEPSGQDIKRTLAEIAAAPLSVPLRKLDGLTRAMLVTAAMRKHRIQSLDALSADQLAECARDAMRELSQKPGRPATDPRAVALVRDLLRLLPAEAPAAERDELLTAALHACGMLAGEKNLERLRLKAGQIL